MPIDNNKGLTKLYWSDIRNQVSKVEPKFAKIVDEINPDKSFPLYLASYPYGFLIADTKSPFIPGKDGNPCRLTDPNIDKEIVNHLGYGKDSLPMGMVLDKEIEYFLDLKESGITIPWLMYKPGSLFPFATILGKESNHSYAPNGVLMTSSGARSAFMLPNIGCVTNHVNLQRDLNLKRPAPKSLYDHWSIFKEIANSSVVKSDWRSKVVYFSINWIDKIHQDKSWLKLKAYLLELAWNRFEYERNRAFYDITFSLLQKKRNLKPNPYLTDTARHLFAISLGTTPGYVPAINEDSLPIHDIQKAFVESYALKKYFPTIMLPSNYNFMKDKNPIYYSLQNPSMYSFSPKSRKASSTMFEMRELEHIMQIFLKDLAKSDGLCTDTILNKVANNVRFHYFHNETDPHNIIKPSTEIIFKDARFESILSDKKPSSISFAEDAKFFRGCISITSRI